MSWEDNTKMELMEAVCEDVKLIYLTKDSRVGFGITDVKPVGCVTRLIS
jgi:hypothetical protein